MIGQNNTVDDLPGVSSAGGIFGTRTTSMLPAVAGTDVSVSSRDLPSASWPHQHDLSVLPLLFGIHMLASHAITVAEVTHSAGRVLLNGSICTLVGMLLV